MTIRLASLKKKRKVFGDSSSNAKHTLKGASSMTLYDDGPDAKVMTVHEGIFPKGTHGHVISCRFIEGTTARVYNFQTDEPIDGFVLGLKSAWYLDRDLTNTSEENVNG